MSLIWGHLAAGSAPNVIPERGEASGTVRLLDADAWAEMNELIPELVREIAAPWRASVEIDYRRGMPPAVNDPAATASFPRNRRGGPRPRHGARGTSEHGRETRVVPGTGAWSPLRLGVRRPGSPEAPDLHSALFDVDEASIGCGARVLAAAAVAAIDELRC